jgi:ABC-type uncharacterized transport system substrate-binding protein
MPVIGYLDSGSSEASQGILPSLHRGLADTGYIAGKTITIEARRANGQVERLPALAKDLVDRRVDIIVAAGAVSSARAAKAATSTIPVVIAGGADPVRYGLGAAQDSSDLSATPVRPWRRPDELHGGDHAARSRGAVRRADPQRRQAADLPIQQPTKFWLAINLKTAKTLGLDVPATLLVRADEVIE